MSFTPFIEAKTGEHVIVDSDIAERLIGRNLSVNQRTGYVTFNFPGERAYFGEFAQ